MARIRREMEEVRVQMTQQEKSDNDIQEWETLISSLSQEDSAVKLLTTRIQKLSTAQTPSSQVPSLISS